MEIEGFRTRHPTGSYSFRFQKEAMRVFTSVVGPDRLAIKKLIVLLDLSIDTFPAN
jgi:hypothetical protein